MALTYPIPLRETDPEWCYLANPLIKKDGIRFNFTKLELEEYLKCAASHEYFIEKYCKIRTLDKGLVDFNLYDYQKRLLGTFNENRFSIVLACRQSGKSITSVMYILWYVCFHPQKLVLVLANKKATSVEMLGRIQLALENLPFFLQPGCKAVNKGSISFSNGSRIEAHSTASDAVRGKSANLVYMDEFAFIKNDAAFYRSTYPTITSGTTSKIIVTSTANGISNMFYKLYIGAVEGINEYQAERVDWWDVPGRDEAWKAQQIANSSPEEFAQEYGNEWLGSSNTLIAAEHLLRMQPVNPIEKHGDVSIYERPVKDREYVGLVDVCKARGQDYSTFTILDVTTRPYVQVATYRNNLISPQIFPDVIYKYAKAYNNAYLIIESNDQGATVFNVLRHTFEYERMFIGRHRSGETEGLEITSKVKRKGCSNLKDLIERGNLVIRDKVTAHELKTFEAKKNSWEAGPGSHDDTVMPLVMFAWFTESNAFEEITDTNLRAMMAEDSKRIVAESVPFVGLPSTEAAYRQGVDSILFGDELGQFERFRRDPDLGIVVEYSPSDVKPFSPYGI